MRQPFHDTFVLPRGRAVLLMIDFQEEQRNDPEYHAEDIARVLANGSALLEAARSGVWPVAHAQNVRDFSVEPPRPFETTSLDGGPSFSDIASGQTDICAEVAPSAGEPVFVKNDASAFKGTGLSDWLQDNGVEWLVLCGLWTEACVAATVRDGMAKGFRIMLVKDACGSGNSFMHESGILNLANRLFGGGICDAARATALFAGLEAYVWRMVDPVPLRYTAGNVSALYDSL